MAQEFRPDSEFSRKLNAGELRTLLERLGEVDLEPPGSEEPTVEDVAEALGHEPQFIENMLREQRAIDRESRISEALREMEEPLYRVERPGLNQSDPMSRHNPIHRQRVITTILDHLPRADHPKRRQKVTEDTKHDHAMRAFAYLFLTAMALIFVALAIKAAVMR